MKRKFKLLLVLCTMFLLAGCSLKQNYNVDITSDKQVTIGFTYAMDNELIDLLVSQSSDSESEGEAEERDITDEDRWKYLTENMTTNASDSGFTYEKYEKDSFKGFTFKSKKVNIDDVTKSEKVDRFYLDGENNSSTTDSQGVIGEILKSALFTKDGNTYKSNMAFKISEQISGSLEYFDLIDMKLVVTLPNKASSNNATTVSTDGKTLTWDLTKIKDDNIDFAFAFSSVSMPLIIGGAVCALIIVCVVFFAIFRKKKNGQDAPTPTPAPVEPIGYNQTSAPVDLMAAPAEVPPVESAPVAQTPVAEAQPVETPVETAPVAEVPTEQTTENTNVENNQGM